MTSDVQKILTVWKEINKREEIKAESLKNVLKLTDNELNKVIEFLYDLGLVEYTKEGNKIFLKMSRESKFLGEIPCFSCPNLSYCSIHDLQKSPLKCPRFIVWINKVLGKS